MTTISRADYQKLSHHTDIMNMAAKMMAESISDSGYCPKENCAVVHENGCAVCILEYYKKEAEKRVPRVNGGGSG